MDFASIIPVDDLSVSGKIIVFHKLPSLEWNSIPGKKIIIVSRKRSYSYFVEVSMNEERWTRVVDYSDYMCRSVDEPFRTVINLDWFFNLFFQQQRSWQNLYFKDVVAKWVVHWPFCVKKKRKNQKKKFVWSYIKIVGNRNTANRIFHLVSMEVRYLTKKFNLTNDIIGKREDYFSWNKNVTSPCLSSKCLISMCHPSNTVQ